MGGACDWEKPAHIPNIASDGVSECIVTLQSYLAIGTTDCSGRGLECYIESYPAPRCFDKGQ
jgi:hypothetical protein